MGGASGAVGPEMCQAALAIAADRRPLRLDARRAAPTSHPFVRRADAPTPRCRSWTSIRRAILVLLDEGFVGNKHRHASA